MKEAEDMKKRIRKELNRFYLNTLRLKNDRDAYYMYMGMLTLAIDIEVITSEEAIRALEKIGVR